MPRVKSMARPVSAVGGEGSKGSGGGGPKKKLKQVPCFEFPKSRLENVDLDAYARDHKWFVRENAWSVFGETEPKPLDDEVIVFMEQFVAGFRFLTTDF